MDKKSFEEMSVIDLSVWMKDNGVQDNYCELLEGK